MGRKDGADEDSVAVKVDSFLGMTSEEEESDSGQNWVSLSRQHVSHIRKGEFIYDPSVVEGIARLGKRLGNIDRYIDNKGGIDPGRYEMLGADLTDFFNLVALFQEKTLKLHAEHEGIMKSIESGKGKKVSLMGRIKRQIHYIRKMARGYCGISVHEKWLSIVKIPRSVQRYQRFENLVFVLNVGLGILDEVSDLLFIVALYQLDSLHHLFYLSLITFVFMAVLRWTVLLYYTTSFSSIWKSIRHVLVSLLSPAVARKSISWISPDGIFERIGFLVAWLFTPVIPELSLSILQREFDDREPLKQNIFGESSGSLFTDPVSSQAKVVYFEVSSMAWISLSFFVKDTLQLGVQTTFLKQGSDEEGEAIGPAFWLTFVTTVFRIIEQMFAYFSAKSDQPSLQNLILLRQLSFNSEDVNNRDPGSRIADFVQNAGGDNPKLYKSFEKDIKPALLREGPQLNEVSDYQVQNPCANLTNCGSNVDINDFFNDVRVLEFNNMHFSQNDSPAAILFVSRCYNLQRIELSFSKFEGQNSETNPPGILLALAAHCPRLDQISLDNCSWVNESHLCNLIETLGENMIRISLRNIPTLTDRTLITIGANCTQLQELFLDQDPTRRSNGPSFTEAGLAAIAKGCSGTLINLQMSYLPYKGSKEAFLGLLQSRYLREVSLAGISCVDDKFLIDLFQKGKSTSDDSRSSRSRLDTLFGRSSQKDDMVAEASRASTRPGFLKSCLREIRLTKTNVRGEGLRYLCESAQLLELLSIGDTETPAALVSYLYKVAPMLRHIEFYNPKELMYSFLKQLSLHVQRLEDTVDDGYDESVHSEVLRILKKNGIVTKAAIERFAEKQIKQSGESLAAYSSMCILIVRLIDAVRREQYRLREDAGQIGYNKRELKEWNLKLQLADTKQVEDDADFFQGSSAMSAEEYIQTRDLSDQAETNQIPLKHLPPFGVMTTKRINILVDADNGEYRFLGKENNVDAPVGRISNIHKITLTKSKHPKSYEEAMEMKKRTSKLGKLMTRNLAVPENAHYFCFAYPATASSKATAKSKTFDAEMGSLRIGGYEQAENLLMSFGGFLYFDRSKAFLSASVLTIGISLSFNGPFNLAKSTTSKLRKRWIDVTLSHLSASSNRVLQFAWVFPHEFRKDVGMDRHNVHGGFAYTFRNADGSRNSNEPAVFFAMADLDDVFLDEREDHDGFP